MVNIKDFIFFLFKLLKIYFNYSKCNILHLVEAASITSTKWGVKGLIAALLKET